MTKKIPDFKSLEEAADYWDTHSFAEYIEDTEPVEIEVNIKTRKIYLEIDNDLSEKLRKISRKKKKELCEFNQLLDTRKNYPGIF